MVGRSVRDKNYTMLSLHLKPSVAHRKVQQTFDNSSIMNPFINHLPSSVSMSQEDCMISSYMMDIVYIEFSLYFKTMPSLQ